MIPKVKVKDLYAVSFIRGTTYMGHFWKDTLNDLCPYCQLPVKKGTIDHIYPLIRGGPNAWWNKTRACYTCNQTKGKHQLLNFLMRIQEGKYPATCRVNRGPFNLGGADGQREVRTNRPGRVASQPAAEEEVRHLEGPSANRVHVR